MNYLNVFIAFLIFNLNVQSSGNMDNSICTQVQSSIFILIENNYSSNCNVSFLKQFDKVANYFTVLNSLQLTQKIAQPSQNLSATATTKTTDTKKPENSFDQNFQAFLTFRGRKYGGSCGIRTYDQLVKSQLLYQLS